MRKKINFKELAVSFLFIFLFYTAHSVDQIYEKAKENPAHFMAVVVFIFILLFIVKIIKSKKEKQQDVYINR
jgi:hypothetical protein